MSASLFVKKSFPFGLLLFPSHTVKNSLLPLLEAFSDVEPVQLHNLLLSEEKPTLLLPVEPGSPSH